MHKLTNLLATAMALILCLGCQPSSYYYNCRNEADIKVETKAAITAATLQFARSAFAGNADQAYVQLTDEAKKIASRDQVASVLDAIRPGGPYDDLKLQQLMTVTGWGDLSQGPSVADCAKNRELSEANVMVAIKKIPEQAYAIVSAKGSQETWFLILWLIPKSDQWQVQSFQAGLATAVGKQAFEIVALARSEKSRGHNLNAGILYASAATVASRGPFYHTKLQDLIEQETHRVPDPEEFRGPPPYKLEGPSGPFSILRVSSFGANGKLYMVVAHEVAPWKESKEVEQRNRALIKAFASRFPEYSEAFAGLVADATEKGGSRRWRTVEENATILIPLGCCE